MFEQRAREGASGKRGVVPWGSVPPRGPSPRRDAVERQQQRWPGVFLPGAIAAEQLDLLPAHLIEQRQAALEPPPELGEASREVARSHEPPDHIAGAVILVGYEREYLGAPPVVGNQGGVLARDVQIDVRQGLLHFVHDQPEQPGVVEHPREQRRAAAAANLEERREPRAHAIPARDEVAAPCARPPPTEWPRVDRERTPPQSPHR